MSTPDEKGKTTELPNELIDQLLAVAGGGAGLTGPDGLLKKLTAALVNRALNAEMTHHLGYETGESPPSEQDNRRNGRRIKHVRTDRGEISVEVPRDRAGTFEPQLVGKHQRSFDGFDDKILSLYARGMTTRDIQRHMEELYGVEVSPDLISRVTDSVLDELAEWQGRPLESVYPIVYIDALVVKIRDQGKVENKAVHIVVGVDEDGGRDVLGMWLERTEGARFWSSILAELKQRGVEDILILCADGLTGLPEAVEANFPKTIFQTCIVHLIRSSTRYVSYKDLKAVCADLRAVYTAPNATEAVRALAHVEERWGERYIQVAKAWRTRMDEWTPFLAFPAELRRAIYTTNTIEALNRILRKALKTRGALPTDEAALKLLYLAIRNAKKTWGKPHRGWLTARMQLAIHFEGRL
ncbi:MAG: IS256 family transposase [Proteobacteria bacterium]|nr:IS256 family transposase [Pseudomonadota bacterium]